MLYFDETKVTDLEAVLFAENDLRIAVCPALEIVWRPFAVLKYQ